MRKSVVTAIVTAIFVVYSFYQRTLGVQATADAGPIPTTTTGVASTSAQSPSSSQSPSGNAAQAPVSSPSTNPAQSNRSRTRAGNASPPIPTAAPAPAQNSGSQYKDGTYAGATADAFYGNLQVQATIANGKLTNVQILQWPNDRSRSIRINQQALPWLVQEAIQAQSGNVDVISGATDSSVAFTQSLQSALNKAKS